MIREEVRTTWGRLEEQRHSAPGLVVLELPEHPSFLLGTDLEGRLHLLLQASEAVPTRQYGALSVGPRELVDGDETRLFLDLACSDQRLREAFFWLVSDLIERTAGIGVSSERVVQVLEEFKALFTASRGMTRSDLVGLVGELDVLEQLASIHPGWQALEWWVRDKQDFVSNDHALEVKSTEAVGGGTITVNGLGQFESDQPLYLAVVECRDGGRDDTVPSRIERLVAAGVPRIELEQRVREVYNPDSPIALAGVATVETRWWRVDEGFPFLRPSDLPESKRAAISQLSYSIPVAAFPSPNRAQKEEVLNAF